MPTDLYDEMREKMFTDECTDAVVGLFRSAEDLEQQRRADIADSFEKFRPGAALLLEEMGIVAPAVIDRVTMWGSVKDRLGFESGLKFVHDNARVTSKNSPTWVYNEDRDPNI